MCRYVHRYDSCQFFPLRAYRFQHCTSTFCRVPSAALSPRSLHHFYCALTVWLWLVWFGLVMNRGSGPSPLRLRLLRRLRLHTPPRRGGARLYLGARGTCAEHDPPPPRPVFGGPRAGARAEVGVRHYAAARERWLLCGFHTSESPACRSIARTPSSPIRISRFSPPRCPPAPAPLLPASSSVPLRFRFGAPTRCRFRGK